MIRRLLARLMPGRPSRDPRIYVAREHPVRQDQVPRGARMVTEKLHEAGFKAFVVGGAVRDLLLGLTPKDFDIATNATPEQVKPLFRRAYIIGRRFRLVHVHVGAEVLEVSTFRAPQIAEESTDEHGRLLSDNVYGTQAEDAARRDFTINALYFDPISEEIWDYVGGVTDVRARRLKLIGAPVTRFREDPVRMLRAIRLAAKVGVAIDPKTAAPIPKLASLIQNVPPARLFDEMQKLLLSGHAVETLAKPARARAFARAAAVARRHSRAAARSQVHRGGAGGNRRAGARGQGGIAGVPVRHAALARGAAAVERRQGARRKAAAGIAHGDGPGARGASATHLDTAPLRSHDQGNLVAAAALRAARRRPAVPVARARALSRRVRFPRVARPLGRSAATARRLVDAIPGRRRGGAGDDAEAGGSAQEKPPIARTRPQAGRGSERRAASERSSRAMAECAQ